MFVCVCVSVSLCVCEGAGVCFYSRLGGWSCPVGFWTVLTGSVDFVSRVISEVTLFVSTYNPN